MPNQEENNVVDVVMTYLSYKKDYFCWRNNNQAVWDAKNNCFRKSPKYSIKGVADIIGIHKPSGKFIAIECKKERSYPSKEQKWFLETINKFGGIAFVARTIDDLIENLTKKI